MVGGRLVVIVQLCTVCPLIACRFPIIIIIIIFFPAISDSELCSFRSFTVHNCGISLAAARTHFPFPIRPLPPLFVCLAVMNFYALSLTFIVYICHSSKHTHLLVHLGGGGDTHRVSRSHCCWHYNKFKSFVAFILIMRNLKCIMQLARL